ncbi:hypothetical protein CJ179_33990 [Rhodococcus sp. ACS1]|uniref:Uncharacterized protein n=1 Tax=Rhodococcus koreensis TaxID=99653 RepID=A0A1H5EU10_9NOCA|nr:MULTISPECIES: hypothetical protein [Rhodococcus]PBC40093.1 hypothetical protein CJ179_33990 [Rhodococcus sp. ACS1]SED94667.1 hypothetical protein SAMN04490239_9370 [Rhodococcus koreensis]
MNMFWTVTVLAATLTVIAASFAAAITADVASRKQLSERTDQAASDLQSRVLTAESLQEGRDWHRDAIRAWTICVVASLSAITFVGVLIILG